MLQKTAPVQNKLTQKTCISNKKALVASFGEVLPEIVIIQNQEQKLASSPQVATNVHYHQCLKPQYQLLQMTIVLTMKA